MSTRGAYGFRLENKDYIAYNHSDSYPSGLGEDILKQVKKLARNKSLKDKVRALKLVSEDSKPNEEDIDKLRQYSNTDVGGQSLTDWYCLLRNIQGNLGAHLEAGYIVNSCGFLGDSLFCEWAYIVNLDTGKLEIYKGFNKNPEARGRYAAIKKDSEYCGVRLVKTFALDSLPDSLDSIKG